uniref:Complement component C7 n=1 Tax=Echeneis naucrates TaxID=173247 RepID=A0A665X6J8_ECHNA
MAVSPLYCQRVNMVHCQWGSYGAWSECDPCTKLQTRSRTIAVFSQFGGNSCAGEATESRGCETTQACPLEEGCGDWFRCRSGKCISRSLQCNGDQDCQEDGLDERSCFTERFNVCNTNIPPPGTQSLGKGFDMVEGKWKATVINTLSFGGQCRVIFSGVNNMFQRLPLSTIQYSNRVKAQTDISDDMYQSEWHYEKDITTREKVSGTTNGFRNFDRKEKYDKTQAKKLLVLKNDVEIAQFQSNSPKYIPISEELWRALGKLPSVYVFAAYRNLLKRFGTHYVSEGSLGGSLNFIIRIDSNSENSLSNLNIPKLGGDPQYSLGFETMHLRDNSKNVEMFKNWADSIRSFPVVINPKLRPLSELVKETPCAAVKRIYLRRAIEQYLSENHPCHCQPCRNNGLAVMDDNTCRCICKTGTSGQACESGAEEEGQAGVIHGSWSCWSSWSSCSANRRSRRRYCSNPAPQNGGQGCAGDVSETSECEDLNLDHLRTVEPQCFDRSLPERPKCGTPPALINGYILEPKDIYLVDSRVQYTCIEGYHLVGTSILQCNAAQTWSTRPGVCKVSKCRITGLADSVKVTPTKLIYDIGEKVTLSCPEGRPLQGQATAICDPSLNFSPNPEDTTCGPGKCYSKRRSTALLFFIKLSGGQCVCKMPFECGSSLQVCGSSIRGNGKTIPMSVCQMHAMQCKGMNFLLVDNDECTWQTRDTTGCTKCHIWETCDDQTNACRCRDSADCATTGLNVCVRMGEDAAAAEQTMSECEAGLRQCKGENLTVTNIVPCFS